MYPRRRFTDWNNGELMIHIGQCDHVALRDQMRAELEWRHEQMRCALRGR